MPAHTGCTKEERPTACQRRLVHAFPPGQTRVSPAVGARFPPVRRTVSRRAASTHGRVGGVRRRTTDRDQVPSVPPSTSSGLVSSNSRFSASATTDGSVCQASSFQGWTVIGIPTALDTRGCEATMYLREPRPHSIRVVPPFRYRKGPIRARGRSSAYPPAPFILVRARI